MENGQYDSDKFESILGKFWEVVGFMLEFAYTDIDKLGTSKHILSLDTVFKKKSWDDTLIKQSFIRLKVNLPSRSLTLRPSNVKSYLPSQ